MEAYKKIMQYLAFAIQKERQRASDCVGLKAKFDAQKEVCRLEDTRKKLRLHFYEYQDWQKMKLE